MSKGSKSLDESYEAPYREQDRFRLGFQGTWVRLGPLLSFSITGDLCFGRFRDNEKAGEQFAGMMGIGIQWVKQYPNLEPFEKL